MCSKSLTVLVFLRVGAEVYVYPAKTGPNNGKDLTAGLKISKQQLYLALESLKGKGVITSNLEHNKVYSALAFEELLKAYIELNEQQAEITKQKKRGTFRKLEKHEKLR